MNTMVYVFWLLLLLGIFTTLFAWRKHQKMQRAARQREQMMLQAMLIEQAKRQAQAAQANAEQKST